MLSRFGLSRLVGRFGRKTLIVASIGAAVVALIASPRSRFHLPWAPSLLRWACLGIFWANAALLLGAIGIMARSKTGDGEPP